MSQSIAGFIKNNKYYPPKNDYIEDRVKSLYSIWEDFLLCMNKAEVIKNPLTKNGISNPLGVHQIPSDSSIKNYYYVNNGKLIDSINQVDRRIQYYLCFHNDMEISECKVFGLYAFWLNRLKPFFLSDYVSDGKKYFSQSFVDSVNEEFSFYFLCAMLKNLSEQLQKSFKMNAISDNLYKEFVYSLKSRAIYQEAMMMIAELMASCLIEGYSDIVQQVYDCNKNNTHL